MSNDLMWSDITFKQKIEMLPLYNISAIMVQFIGDSKKYEFHSVFHSDSVCLRKT